MAAANRGKPFFSSAHSGLWTNYQSTGLPNGVSGKGLGGKMRTMPKGPTSMIDQRPEFVHVPHVRNYTGLVGARITAMWLPENAKKKNMRPKHEIFNTSDADGVALRNGKRLTNLCLPYDKSMCDDVRLGRELNESLHGLEHTPLLQQQWDPEHVTAAPEGFTKKDSAGRVLPAAILPDFPRFYDREMFAEMDQWQRTTNEKKMNRSNETFIYYHFWAHDDEWIYKRRIDVWDYVKSTAQEYLREKLSSVQRQLYGAERSYPANESGVLLRHHPIKRLSTDRGIISFQLFVTCKPADPSAAQLSGHELRYKISSEDAWRSLTLSTEGTALITFRVPEALLSTDRITISVGDEALAFPCNPDAPEHQKAQLDLTPPSDLVRALPGWTKEEVVELYRQELQSFEEELVNTLGNLDAMMQPSPILYAAQNELMNCGPTERYAPLQSHKNHDWWFHHQSFSLSLPFFDEEFMHRLQNWRHVVNQKVGNSAWMDQMKQHSPQPVNVLMQVFRKHNHVWDSRVYKVEHDTPGEYQEETSQEWSFVEDRGEPQPTPPAQVDPSSLPPPLEGVEAEDTDPLDLAYTVWSQVRTPTDELLFDNVARTPAEEYWQDSLAARAKHNDPLTPEHQDGLEVDVKPKFPAAPEAERKKYVRRVGKLYRKYMNPYHPNPQKFVTKSFKSNTTIDEQFYY